METELTFSQSSTCCCSGVWEVESRGLEVIPKQVLNHLDNPAIPVRVLQPLFLQSRIIEQHHTDLALLDHLPKLQK